MPSISKQTTKPKANPAAANGSAWDLSSGLKVLLYGAPGTGKTTFWASYPGEILALITSGGKRPEELKSIDTPENRKRIDARIISSTDQFYRAIEDAGNYGMVVQDHATSLQDIFLAETMGWTEVAEQRPIIGGNKAVWGDVASMSKKAYAKLFNLPQHVVIVAQQRTFGDDESSSSLISPTVGAAVTPSVMNWLGQASSYIVQTFIRPRMIQSSKKGINGKTEVTKKRDGVEFCLRCERSDVFITKFRIVKGLPLVDVITDPTFDKLLAATKGELR